MITKRDVFVFFAGAAFFHTVSHFLLPYYFTLPLQVGSITLTAHLNNWIVGLSALLTLALLWGAKKAK